ncbi:hypothetical protein FB561_4024 [Kribbella amoyensis]|uniref:WD40 repeat protein n=1 Tax=Kribbella amoyensis TaxID=996641 RepID=A0A561BVJ2_9ACTN|nr:hypothetical protein [Kribbella amoyensis]TWD82878.1 hypothetical protein FB561_4024 [Kribbella amoyensis]
MNLDQRLTDALDAAARTVPGDAVPPPVPVRPVRRTRPVLVIAVAAAAVIAAVAVPVVLSRNDDRGQVATGTCAAPPAVEPLAYPRQNGTKPATPELDKLPFGPPPRVPFTMAPNREGAGGYLEDLGVRVPVEKGFTYFSLGRVDCGWIIGRQRYGSGGELEIGRLDTSGAYRSFGPFTGDGFSLSPDRSQVVFVTPTGDDQARVTVRNVATGKEATSWPTDREAEVLGWNSNGIWFMPERERSRTQLWVPGSDPVSVDTSGRRLTAYRTTDRLLLSEQEQVDEDGKGPGPCVRVAVLEGTRLRTVREQCGASGAALSPDGELLVTGGAVVAGIEVETGARTRLNVSPLLLDADFQAIWEDDTHLIDQTGVGSTREATLRCDVAGGRCERIEDGPQQTGPAGPDLGRP